jgi:hypothetical protein
MENSHMLRTSTSDLQQYYSASIRCYATAGKHVAHLSHTCYVAGVMRVSCGRFPWKAATLVISVERGSQIIGFL